MNISELIARLEALRAEHGDHMVIPESAVSPDDSIIDLQDIISFRDGSKDIGHRYILWTK